MTKLVRFFKSKGTKIKLVISSPSENQENASIDLALFGYFMSISLPAWVLPPLKKWQDLERYEWAKPGKDGRKGYFKTIQREFGFYLFENHFNIMYGAQTDSSNTEKRWSCFLPWSEWRFSCYQMWDAEGGRYKWNHNEYFLIKKVDRSAALEMSRMAFEMRREVMRSMPKTYFAFKDYDGEEIQACVFIEERKWLKGEKLFSWLSFFYPAKVIKSLNISFSKGVGPKKGSWKGGTLGHGIELLPDEDLTGAFLRYAKEHGFTEVRSSTEWEGAPDPIRTSE